MNIVLTNDDGYNEPGLAELRQRVEPFGDVVVVAPRHPQSITGHRVTLREPIPVERVSENEYIVDGSPADCTRLALKCFQPDADWLIAGINPGANLGTDVYQSGTVAAAREAAMLGVRAIAISQYIAPQRAIDWEVTGMHAARILAKWMREKRVPGAYWNINLPHPLDADAALIDQVCDCDNLPHRFGFEKKDGQYWYAGVFHDRPRTPGRDVDVCLSGRIAVTRLKV